MAVKPSNKERQIKEIVRCGQDPVYFLTTYCKIQHTSRGLIPFELFDFQKDCIGDFVQHRLNIILKARQLGISTITSGFAVWLALFHKHQSILVIATKKSTAINFIRKARVMIKNLPQWMMIARMVGDSKQELEFSHGSFIKAVPTSEDAGRSEALACLIIDEAAWIRNFSELWTGLYSTISTGGRCIILSTPNGVGGQYHKLYTDAEQGINDFNPICLPWSVHPDHDDDWYEHECKQLGSRKKVAQELDCEFIASGDTFLSMDDIEWVRHSIVPPIDKLSEDRSLWVWGHPMREHRYIISADVSRGDSQDFSAFHVMDMDKAEVVAEYKGRMPPDRFGELLADTGKRYNNALLCPENNSYGYATLVKLRDLRYPRIYTQNSKAVYIVDYIPVTDDVAKMGFNTGPASRIRILSKLEEIIRNKLIKIHSSRLYDELKTFVWTGNKAQAMKGRHDDLVMALAIGLWIYDVSEGHSNHDTVLAENMLAAMGVSGHSLDQVPNSGQGIRSGRDFYLPHMGNMSSIEGEIDEQAPTDPRFGGVDFSWIMK